MKICMVLYDLQGFGGLEELTVTLAIGLQQRGHQVSILSSTWTPADNQYLLRLSDNEVEYFQPPKWLSLPASDWSTKEKMLNAAMWLATPFVYLMASGLFLRRRSSWTQSLTSARGWMHGVLQSRLIGPDRREALGRLLLNRLRWRWHPDLLHIQGYTSTLHYVLDWAYSKKIPVVYEEHQTPDPQFDWWKDFQKRINKAARVVAVSETSGQALRTVCGVTRPIVVRNPLVADPSASGWHKNGNSRPEDAPIRVTTVARLYVTKGLTYLLEAIAQVKETHPNTEFKVYGDGELRDELLAYASNLGLNGNDIFVGPFTSRDDLSDIMDRTDIFAMSSILEGQPVCVVEAMSYGCPIVTTTVGGIPEIIEDGVNGLLCQPSDPTCLAEKIRLLIDDPALRTRLGQSARRSYEDGPFQPDAVSDLFNSVYQEVLQEERSEQGNNQSLVSLVDGPPIANQE